MSSIAFLKKLSDQELIVSLKDLISEEREIQTAILHHLREVEDRKIYLQSGYGSLFSYLTEGLGYAEASAYRRIQSMRLIRSVPEVEGKLESGEMSLSVASRLQGYIQQEDKRRKEDGQKPVSLEEKKILVEQLQGTSDRQCEQKLAELSPELALPKEKARPITDDAIMLQFTVNKKLFNKIEQLKALWSHQNPEGKLELLLEKLVDSALEKADPIQESSKQKSQLPAPESGCTFGRYIPKALKDQIWRRDQGRCQFKDPRTGKFCRSNHLIEIDHRYPVALGGENSPSNLRLLCRNHNQYRQRLLDAS